VRPDNCLEELERCVKSYGFVAVNLNPDPTGGFWRDPPLTDRWYYPVYERSWSSSTCPPWCMSAPRSIRRKVFETNATRVYRLDRTAYFKRRG
jgi:predicted TIM-barrel fold metal-dependent hydrolase